MNSEAGVNLAGVGLAKSRLAAGGLAGVVEASGVGRLDGAGLAESRLAAGGLAGVGLVKNRPAFILIELLISLVIISALWGVGLSATGVLNRHTVRHEAERALAWLESAIAEADSRQVDLRLRKGAASTLEVYLKGTSGVYSKFEASSGCSLMMNDKDGEPPAKSPQSVYSHKWRTMTPGGHITFTYTGKGDKSGGEYYLYFSGQGRLRLADKPNDDNQDEENRPEDDNKLNWDD